MKPFNLKKALKGKPVVLRNGDKAFVTADIRKFSHQLKDDLIGFSDTADGGNTLSWKADGRYLINKPCDLDIVGMWKGRNKHKAKHKSSLKRV